jgi:phosphoribosylformylglycinamidine synthase
MYLAKVFVRHKKGILDPQGKTVKDALHALKYSSVTEVKIGKLIDVKLDAKSMEDARHQLNEMCKKVLTNPVIEQYSFEIEEL